jgi:peptide/nickel transport system substrate-binding protein
MSGITPLPAGISLLWPGLIILALCTACTGPTAPPTPTPSPLPSPTPSPTPEPKRLTVCLPGEPDSLYLYGTDDPAAQHVWQAIYDGPFDNRNYAYQPVILTGIPSLADGSAAIETVTVQAGARILSAAGEVVQLAPGVTVQDAAGQRITSDGTPVLMQQMVVTFTLQPDLYWSDGALLTADDSAFSFELAADPATPTDKYAVERTASYRAADVRTVVWSGVPGFLDRAYFLNFWHPLPRHAWGHLSAAGLLSADLSTREPLGWGPFVLREWVDGDHIALARNPLYFRAPEGLPRLDEVTFRFIADPAALAEELVAGRCDVVTHEAADAVRAVLPAQPQIEVRPAYDARWEFLAFGITPAADYARPDLFEDVRVRQAVAQCIDRQTVANQVLGPSGRVLHNMLPPEHPLYAGSVLTTWEYDPSAGQALLAAAGWYDEDGDGVREAHHVPGLADGTPFQITYRTTGDPLRVQTAGLVQPYLAACGIQASVETLPAGTFFAPGPEGVLFGRRFDLAQFALVAQPDPTCDLFLSSQMPDAGRWDRPNVAGFLDDEYDTACLAALEALPGSDVYAAGNAEAQRIFSERLPGLPLFQRLKLTLARTPVIGLAPDPTQASELWNVEQLDLRP